MKSTCAFKFLLLSAFVSLWATAVSLPAASEFENIDTKLTQAAEIRSQTAKMKSDWIEEKSRLETLVLSYQTALEQNLKKLKSLEQARLNGGRDVSVVAEKIARDESAAKMLSDYIEKKFEEISRNPTAKKILTDSSLLPKNLKDMNLDEKLRSLSAALTKLYSEDMKFQKSGNSFSTGAFVSGEGKLGGSVSEMKVDRAGGAK